MKIEDCILEFSVLRWFPFHSNAIAPTTFVGMTQRSILAAENLKLPVAKQ